MTDETATPTPDAEAVPAAESAAAPTSDPLSGAVPTPTPASPAAEAWNDVVARMSELGVALSAWAKSAADDPQNKQRLESVRAGVNEMARQADVAFGKVTSTEFGQQVSQGAQQAGEAIGGAAQQVSDAAAPHVATALSGLAGFFGQAAAKVDEAVNRDRAPEAAPPATPASPAEAPQSEPSPKPDEQV